MGGLGLRSAVRCSRAAYWALVDALPMIQKGNSAVADMVERAMVNNVFPEEGCLFELARATDQLDREEFVERPSWPEVHRGRRPPKSVSQEPGERQHGWQYWASSASDRHFRKITMLSGQTAANRAHLRSHFGHNAGGAFAYAPTAPEYVIPPHLFWTLLLERLRIPLSITEATCSGCGAPLDPRGIHRAACTRSGRVRKRAAPVERMLARVFREAGARVRFNALLRDMNVGVAASDARRIEVLAQNLPCFRGSQLAVDVTLRSALGCSGETQQGAADIDGAILLQARRDKETSCPGLVLWICNDLSDIQQMLRGDTPP